MTRFIIVSVVLCSLLWTLQAAATAIPTLSQLPAGERWFSVTMNGEQVGFARQQIRVTDDGYRFESDGSVKMMVLGFSREAASHEVYLVGKDLALRSFAVEQSIDRSPMKIQGEMTGKGVKLSVESGGTRKEKLLKFKGAVYPPPILNLFPLFKGFVDGKKYKVAMLDVEALKVKEVVVSAVARETMSGAGPAFHLRNDLYPFVSNDIWVDPAGNTIRESVREGLVVTQTEDEAAIRRFILSAAVAKKDLVLDFSLVRTDRTIDRPASVRQLEVGLTGIPTGLTLPDGAGQRVTREPDGRVVLAVNRKKPGAVDRQQVDDSGTAQFLAATDRIPADHPRLQELTRQLTDKEKTPLAVAERLTAWVAATIADAVIDSQSPIETLDSKKGNCQSHARLYAALARAAGIPTKFVSGLVYLPKQGFLYHSWAESYLGEWVAVDPTFGQFPADATHLKLAEGEGADDLAPLASLVGAIRATIIKVVE